MAPGLHLRWVLDGNFKVDGSLKMYAMVIGWVVGLELLKAKTVLMKVYAPDVATLEWVVVIRA